MALTGTVLRSKVLRDTCGGSHAFTILLPSSAAANRSALLAASREWEAQVQKQPPLQRHRAQLAVDTAFIAAEAVTRPTPDRFIVVAQDDTGALRGLSLVTFKARPAPGTWHLDLHVVSPKDQLGSAKDCATRGIGSEMLGADMAIMTSRACTRTELTPLDDKAASFWRSRGFQPDRHGLGLSCPGMEGLAAAYAHSPTDDEDMVTVDPAQLARFSLYARETLIAASFTPGGST